MGMASRLTELRSGHLAAVEVNESASPQVDKSTIRERYQRRTYHIRPDQIERIETAAFYRKLDISEIIRRAIDTYLDPEDPGLQVHR